MQINQRVTVACAGLQWGIWPNAGFEHHLLYLDIRLDIRFFPQKTPKCQLTYWRKCILLPCMSLRALICYKRKLGYSKDPFPRQLCSLSQLCWWNMGKALGVTATALLPAAGVTHGLVSLDWHCHALLAVARSGNGFGGYIKSVPTHQQSQQLTAAVPGKARETSSPCRSRLHATWEKTHQVRANGILLINHELDFC